MSPGKIRLFNLPAITLNQFFDIASDCGLSFCESHDYMEYPAFIGSFSSDVFVDELLAAIKRYVVAVAHNSNKLYRKLTISGKRLSFEAEGNTYVVQFSVYKNKDD